MTQIDKRRWTYALWIVACLVVSLFWLIYPVYVIRPFRYQGVRELKAALIVLRFRPAVMVLLTLTAIASAVFYWRLQPRILRRIVALVGVIGVCASAALSRINIYEHMFHPIGRPVFTSIGESKLHKDEQLLTIRVAGAARAYPVRSISYHHIVNDTVGGVPIVATY